MARAYQFNDLVYFSGLTENQAKGLVQTGVIRPDIKRAKGTGKFRQFGFLDVVEARIVHELYRLPGMLSGVTVSIALDSLRTLTALDALDDTGWARFLDPASRDRTAIFFLCWSPRQRWSVIDDTTLAARIASDEVIVAVRLDLLLLELETKTHDHCTEEERTRLWKPRRAPRHPPAASDSDQQMPGTATDDRTRRLPRVARRADEGRP